MGKQEFNLLDWVTAVSNTDERNYTTPEEVKEQLKELGVQMRNICAENNIPLLLAFAHTSDEKAVIISESHHFLPLHRVPLELLIGLIAVKSGAGDAITIGADLLKYAKEE